MVIDPTLPMRSSGIGATGQPRHSLTERWLPIVH
jgi:hypothetical protein